MLLADPTPSQLAMLMAWEETLRQDDGDGKAGGTASLADADTGNQALKVRDSVTYTRDWVTYTMEAALLALQEDGSVGMEYVERKKLGIFPSRHVMVTKLGPTSFPTSSFEQQLWAKLGEKTVSASKLVGSWFGAAADDPWAKMRRRIQDNLFEAGLVTKQQEDAHRGRISGAVHGKTKTVFHPEPRAKELLTQIEALHTRLTQPDEPGDELRGKLFREVSRTISSKKSQEAPDI